MEPSHNNTVRSLLLFVIIGVLLLAAVILGVRWARGRSDQIATANQPTVQQPAPQQAQEQKQPEPQPAPAATPQPQAAPNTNKPAPAPSTTPSHVPATGMEDAILPIMVLAATVFAATTYVQSRRRLIQFK